jgi:hypothetical protein
MEIDGKNLGVGGMRGMQACEQGLETAGREAKNGHEKTVCVGQSELQERHKTPDSPAIDTRVGPGLGTLQENWADHLRG